MKLAIVGTGALASLFAARLAPLAQVTMIGTWAAQLAAIREKGLVLEEPDGSRRTVAVAVTTDPMKARPADVALILVKSYQTGRAAKAAAAVLAPSGWALTLQNGLGNLETLVSALGKGRAFAGTTSEGATMQAPGIVRHAGRGRTYLARPTSGSQLLVDLSDLFEEAGFVTRLVEDVESLIWSKLAVNAGINPLTALLEVPNGFLVENETVRALMTQAAAEVVELARVQQIELPYEDVTGRAAEVAAATSANYSSMLQDYQNGRPTELEAITGAVVRLAGELDVPVPVNAALLLLLKHKLAGRSWTAQIDTLPTALWQRFSTVLRAMPAQPGHPD